MTAPRAGVRARVQAQERSGGTRFPCFDGYRAIAAGSVLLTHVSFITGQNGKEPFGPLFARMDAGVAVFFLISGFLLYRPFVSARLAGRPGLALWPYFRRRALRIYPAWWAVLAVVIVGFGATVSSPGELLSYVTLTHLYRASTFQGPTTHPGLPLMATGHPLSLSWSLCCEVSFYVFLPIYAAVLRQIGRGRHVAATRRLGHEVAGLALLYATALGFRTVLLFGVITHGPTDVHGNLLNWLPNQLDLFALGMALAVGSVWVAEHGGRVPLGLDRRWAPAISWALAALSFWAVSHWVGLPTTKIDYSIASQYWRQALYGFTALFLLLPGVFGPQDRSGVRRFLRLAPMAWLGLISYGVYLWQDLVIERTLVAFDQGAFVGPFLRVLAVVVPVTIAIATVSWFVIERPALRFKDGRPRPRPRPQADLAGGAA